MSTFDALIGQIKGKLNSYANFWVDISNICSFPPEVVRYNSLKPMMFIGFLQWHNICRLDIEYDNNKYWKSRTQ